MHDGFRDCYNWRTVLLSSTRQTCCVYIKYKYNCSANHAAIFLYLRSLNSH